MSKKLNFEKGLFVVLGLIISCLAVLSFMPNNDNRVYAVGGGDVTTSYSYTGPNLILSLKTYFSQDNSASGITYNRTRYYSFNVVNLTTNVARFHFTNEGNYGFSFDFSFSDFVDYTVNYPSGSVTRYGLASNYYSIGTDSRGGGLAVFINFYISTSRDFNANVSSVEITPNYIRYYDENNNYFEFGYERGDLFYADRTYITNVDINNPYYWNGYQDGLLDGSNSGYNNGYDAGKIVGNAQGYADGLSASNTYTFNSLFGSVLDAPIQALTGLLSFDLLGVNLFGLFTGLLTLAVIIWILKLVFGGK